VTRDTNAPLDEGRCAVIRSPKTGTSSIRLVPSIRQWLPTHSGYVSLSQARRRTVRDREMGTPANGSDTLPVLKRAKAWVIRHGRLAGDLHG